MWPSVAYVVEENKLGTAYGLMTLIQNVGLAGFNLLIGWANDYAGASAREPGRLQPRHVDLLVPGLLRPLLRPAAAAQRVRAARSRPRDDQAGDRRSTSCRKTSGKDTMPQSTVAILRTRPATVLRDYHELMNLAGYQDVIAKDADTALKVNISWHFFFPGSSTVPWQLDGVIRALKADGYDPDADPRLPQPHGRHRRAPRRAREQADQRRRGPRPAQRPPLRGRGVDRHQGRGRRPDEEVPVPERGLPAGLPDPAAVHRREHHPPADGEDARLHDDDRRDEERVRRPAERAAALDAPGHPRDARGPADDPEEDPPRRVRRDGRHLRRRRPRAALHDAAREERDPGERGPGGDRRRGREADGHGSAVHQVHPAGARRGARLRRPARDRDRRRRGGRQRELALRRARSRR